MRVLVVGLGLVLYVVGCGSPCQQIKATRCQGQIVETCGSNMKWQRALDCSQVKPIKPNAPKVWACGQTATGHTCLPVFPAPVKTIAVPTTVPATAPASAPATGGK